MPFFPSRGRTGKAPSAGLPSPLAASGADPFPKTAPRSGKDGSPRAAPPTAFRLSALGSLLPPETKKAAPQEGPRRSPNPDVPPPRGQTYCPPGFRFGSGVKTNPPFCRPFRFLHFFRAGPELSRQAVRSRTVRQASDFPNRSVGKNPAFRQPVPADRA